TSTTQIYSLSLHDALPISHVMEAALTADYAFVKAWKGDPMGNLLFRRTTRNFAPMMAMAARTTIAEVEELVPAGGIDPNAVTTRSEEHTSELQSLAYLVCR